jgi:hypothetical protein
MITISKKGQKSCKGWREELMQFDYYKGALLIEQYSVI